MKPIPEITRRVRGSALALFCLLLGVSTALASGASPSVARYVLAQQAYERGNYPQSVAYAEEAAELARESEGESTLAYARALSIGAAAHLAMADYESAKAGFERALPIIVGSAETTAEAKASAYHNLAEVHRELQEYDRALQLYRSALDIVEGAYGPASLQSARATAALALAHHSMGDLANAEPLYRRAMAIADAPGSGERAPSAVLANLAELLWRQNRLDEAEVLVTRALAIETQELGPDHPNVATTLNTLAGIQADRGQDEQALASYQRALEIRRHALGPTHPSLGTVHSNMAVTYRDLARYDEAVTHFTEAVRILDAAPGHAADAGENRRALAETYRTMGRPDTAAALDE